jgi:hypothetical protein
MVQVDSIVSKQLFIIRNIINENNERKKELDMKERTIIELTTELDKHEESPIKQAELAYTIQRLQQEFNELKKKEEDNAQYNSMPDDATLREIRHSLMMIQCTALEIEFDRKQNEAMADTKKKMLAYNKQSY